MAGQLLLDIDYEISAQCETSNYLDTHRWGYYSICSKPQAHSRDYRVPFQRSYPLDTLPSMLKLASKDQDSDYWITQAVFSRKNRRKVNLAHVGVAFVDLDYYKVRSLADCQPEAVSELVLKRCQQYEIPMPSLIVDSGQGLQIKWFHDKLPAKVLPRWEYLQTWLNQLLLDLGADMGAKDISRILRVVQTVNQKNRFSVRVLWVQDEGYTQEPYNFNDLIETVQRAHINHFRLTPTVPTRTRAKRQGKAPVTQLRLNSKQFSEDSLNWSRVCDLKKLVQLRGDMGDGFREPMAFYLCNHYALRYSRDLALKPMDEWHEFRNLCKTAAPDWNEKKIREKTSNLYQLTLDDANGKTVEFMGKEYRPLYTPKNALLIDLFGITPEEQRKMITIIGEEEYQRREGIRKSTEEYKEADRAYQEAKRREAGARLQAEYLSEVKEKADKKREQAIALHKQGLSVRAIAKEMGCGKSTVSRYLNSEKKKSVPPLVGA
ncbi:MAG: helix-turn-helix domain-containing protein [Shewanella sp.]|nr:helix-turn-helix domain-containing protein [Shewanella sp.]MCF1459499.1 helix-turn-helix domain-containing protein [Shewanella sp.]